MTKKEIIRLQKKYDLTQLEYDLLQMEGLELAPYKCPAGKWTIGVGRNLEDNPLNKYDVIRLLIMETEEQKRFFFISLLREDIKVTRGDVRRTLTRAFIAIRKDRVRLDVLLNMCYQMGVKKVSAFKKMIAAIKLQSWNLAAVEMLDSKWARQMAKYGSKRAKLLAKRMRTGKIEKGGVYAKS